MDILFYGFRHGHIFTLYDMAKKSPDIGNIYCIEDNAEARKAASDGHGIEFLDMSYEEAFEKLSFDAVAIGGRYGDRGCAVIEAMRHGKHIIADKPVCISLSELSEIERLSKEKSLKLACMLDLRYMPSAVTAKRIYESGKYGKICNISFDGQHCIDYANRPSWYFEKGMHGGTVNDLGIHGVDLVRHIFGVEFLKTDFADVRNRYAYRHKDFCDCAIFVCTVSGGAKVMADVSYSAPANQSAISTYWQFRCWMEKGMMLFSWNSSDVTVYDSDGNAVTYAGTVSEGDYLSDFVSEIRQGGNSFTESVIASSKACLGIQAAADALK